MNWRARWDAIAPSRPALGFATRLALTLTVTVVLIGAVGYAVLSDQFQDRVLHRYAADQGADVNSLQQPRLGTDGPDVRELHELSAISRSVTPPPSRPPRRSERSGTSSRRTR